MTTTYAHAEKNVLQGDQQSPAPALCLYISEIFRSIQGESSFAGLPCTFVRLAGCNLRCTWCDSEYTFTGGQKMTLDEVGAEVQRLSANGLVEITGGEPMLQERAVVPLMKSLLHRGYRVLLETSGACPLARVPVEVHKIVDVKCPGSSEGDSFCMENLEALRPHDEVKFVLADRTDYEFACDFIRRYAVQTKVGNILLSPALRKQATGSRSSDNCLLDPRQLAEWMLADDLPARLSLQIHKFIWDPAARGV